MADIKITADFFNDAAAVEQDINNFASANDNYTTANGESGVGSNKTLTHDKIYQATKGFISGAVQSKKTFIIIPFSQFSPHTNDDIDLLLNVTNDERTEFNDKGRWNETFNATFAKLGYEYEYCYYRNESLPFGVLVSWDTGTGTNDVNLAMAQEKYGKFVYPKYHYVLPTKDEVLESYADESSNLQLTDVLETTFNLVNTLINGAIATNKKYIFVLWSDINKANSDYVKAQFYTEDNKIREHIWTVDDIISTYSTQTSNSPIVTITNNNSNKKFSIPGLLSRTEPAGHAYKYEPVLDPSKVPIGFILSWHTDSDTATQNSINSILSSYGVTSDGDEEILILPIFSGVDQAVHQTDIRKTMRSNYIKTIADKIQSKLTAAFNKSESSAAILWTEISNSNANSVRTEWYTSDQFSKTLQAKLYDETAEPKKSISAGNPFTILGALSELNICKKLSSTDEGKQVYWGYIHYKDADSAYTNSCGIVVSYADYATAKSQIEAIQTTYRNTEDPAKKSNNS